MENKGENLAKLYTADFILLSDSELIKTFEAYSYGVNLAHRFKDEVALEVAGNIIIERKLKTLEELRAIISKDKTEVSEYLDTINSIPKK